MVTPLAMRMFLFVVHVPERLHAVCEEQLMVTDLPGRLPYRLATRAAKTISLTVSPPVQEVMATFPLMFWSDEPKSMVLIPVVMISPPLISTIDGNEILVNVLMARVVVPSIY